MPIRVFEELKQYVGFTDEDANRLQEMGPIVVPEIPKLVERFYAQIRRHDDARRVIASPAVAERLRETLAEWVRTLFSGHYDEAYVLRRAEIGSAHVRVGLPQHYMFGAMELIRQEIAAVVRRANPPGATDMLESLQRLLTIELGVMLETYQQHHAERVRETERVAVHEQLSRTEHLAQIGQLAASLAHEIKNPLAGISGAIQIMRGSMAADDPQRSILDEILRQVTRLDGTVKDLLIYARPKPPRFEPCNPHRFVERALTVLGQEPALQRVRIEVEIDPALSIMHADQAQLEQVLMNLLINAADASSDGGPVLVRLAEDRQGFLLEVRDRGCGMSEQDTRRAFEAFYTRKSKGTGLGLPICKKIVEAHGGSITINSTRGVGTTVTVRLPFQQSSDSQD